MSSGKMRVRDIGKPECTASGERVRSSWTAYGSAYQLTRRLSDQFTRFLITIMEEENLHSATGVAFPGTSRAPPMTTTRPTRSCTHFASSRIMSARLVIGPSTMYVISLGALWRRRSSATSYAGLWDTRRCGVSSPLRTSAGTFSSGWCSYVLPSPSLVEVSEVDRRSYDISHTVRESTWRYVVRRLEALWDL